MKRIGIVGSRRRVGRLVMEVIEEKLLELYEEGDIIVSGGCYKGADHYAEELAKKHQIPILILYARWNVYGKSAGHKRNTTIARLSDVLIAVPANDRTGGTEDTIKKFENKLLKPILL